MVKQWLAGQDSFGTWAKFNYRGESGYGTTMGGCCSLVVTLMTAFFVTVQFYGFLFDPAYNQSSTTIYLSDATDSNEYKMRPGDFLPTFAVHTFHNPTGEEVVNEWNNAEWFDIYFVQYHLDPVGDPDKEHSFDRIEAINCQEYIEGPYWDQYDDIERQHAIKQLEMPDYQLCPNVPSYTLSGAARNIKGKGLIFHVDAVEGVDNEWIQDTIVYTSMINRYFTPKLVNSHGYMEFIAVTENKFPLSPASSVQQILYVSQNDILYYDFPIFDTSQIQAFNLGTEYKDYKVDTSQETTFINYDNKNPLFEGWVVQSRKQNEVVWSVNSLDLILGLVGGITSIIWSFLGIMIGPYEDFKFNQSLAGSIYPTSPQRDEDEPPIDSRDEAREALEGTILERDKFSYNFLEYRTTGFLRSCCCCFLSKTSLWWKKRDFHYNRYEKAVERLNGEIDILKHVQNQRISEFISKLILRKHQRALVQSFNKYQLDDMIKEEEAKKVRDQFIKSMFSETDILEDERLTDDMKELLQEIRDKFDAENIVADLCILYEVTGFKDPSAEPDFWSQYMDFFELGDCLNMIRTDKLDERDLEFEQRKQYQARMSVKRPNGDQAESRASSIMRRKGTRTESIAGIQPQSQLLNPQLSIQDEDHERQGD